MKIVLAGYGHKSFGALARQYGLWKLYSAFNERRIIEAWPTEYPLIVDSGAHTWNKINMAHVGSKNDPTRLPPIEKWAEQYLDWLGSNDNPRWVFVELDCYAELPTSLIDAMDKEARRRLKRAKWMRVYHTRCDGGTLTTIRRWLDDGHTYIGLGLDSLPTWPRLFALTRDRIRYHGFAATKEEILLRFPLFSADSTTAITAARYGGSFEGTKVRSKEWLKRHQKVGAVDQGIARQVELGVQAMHALQKKVTEVWEHRGVVWTDPF